jgi:hypothetical protein
MMRYKTDVGTSAIGFEVREGGAWVAMGAAASDLRLKHDIVKLDSQTVMDRLAQVQGVSYRLKAEGDDGRTHYGVIAQDLERVFPELVNGGNAPNDMKSVRYLEFTGLLIEAAKELKTENDDLKTRLAAIETDVKGMKAHTGYGISKASFEGNGILFLLIGFGLSAVAFTLGGTVRVRRK